MKLQLVDIEKRLGFKLKQDAFCLGLDTASTTGVAVVYTNHKTIEIETSIIKIPPLPRGTEDKSEKYEECLDILINLVRDFKKTLDARNKNETILVLENSYLGFDPWTFGFLKGCMGLLYAEFYDNFEKIKIIFPISARKAVGFKSILPKGTKSKEKKKEIMQFISNIVEEEITDDNCADALMLAFAGLKEVQTEKRKKKK